MSKLIAANKLYVLPGSKRKKTVLENLKYKKENMPKCFILPLLHNTSFFSQSNLPCKCSSRLAYASIFSQAINHTCHESALLIPPPRLNLPCKDQKCRPSNHPLLVSSFSSPFHLHLQMSMFRKEKRVDGDLDWNQGW